VSRLIALIVLVAALALAPAAEATPTKTTQINATLVGTGCVTGLGCMTTSSHSCLCLTTFVQFEGRTNISPPLGTLAFHGDYLDGRFCSQVGVDFTCLVPFTYFRSLTLTLSAPNGDRLVLAEGRFTTTTPPPLFTFGANRVQGAWSVDSAKSTGRFTRYTGSGTYTLSYEGHTFTTALAGSLTFE
jgi:hypothetical protein